MPAPTPAPVKNAANLCRKDEPPRFAAGAGGETGRLVFPAEIGGVFYGGRGGGRHRVLPPIQGECATTRPFLFVHVRCIRALHMIYSHSFRWEVMRQEVCSWRQLVCALGGFRSNDNKKRVTSPNFSLLFRRLSS